MKAIPILLLAGLLAAGPLYAQSRNASFMNPNSGGGAASGAGKSGNMANTVVADPSTIDAGETLVNVARRITVFFHNGFRAPVQINELTLNADGNVRSKVMSDDCKTLKTLPVSDRCSIAIEITPSSPGPWSVELLLTHTGQGRIARAEVTGSTLGKADEKSEGLAISKKIAAPLDFGSVKPFVERAARTMLIENDSAEKLIISKIDLISDDEGLSLRDVGCKEGDELKPGESCPVTVMWAPVEPGTIATDLLINHNGNLGYVVVPIRGKSESEENTALAEDGKGAKRKAPSSQKSRSTGSKGGSEQAAKPSATQLESLPVTRSENTSTPPPRQEQPSPSELASNMPPIQSSDVAPKKKARKAPPKKELVEEQAAEEETSEEAGTEEIIPPKLLLMGTIGQRAILGDEEGQTHMLSLGEKVDVGGASVELLQLDASRAVVSVAGKRQELRLRNAPSFMPSKTAAGGSSGGASESSSGESGGKKSKKKTSSSEQAAESSGNTNTSGAGDGSAPASTSSTSSGTSTTPSGSSTGGTSGNTGLPSSLTVEDVLKMMN